VTVWDRQRPAEVIEVPGHTPADIAYLIGDAVFVADTIFMPDLGSARADYRVETLGLYASAKRISPSRWNPGLHLP
jgi:glyoxylase-like metal-dependent hydrolase (beta-lactamase superfamily II)